MRSNLWPLLSAQRSYKYTTMQIATTSTVWEFESSQILLCHQYWSLIGFHGSVWVCVCVRETEIERERKMAVFLQFHASCSMNLDYWRLNSYLLIAFIAVFLKKATRFRSHSSLQNRLKTAAELTTITEFFGSLPPSPSISLGLFYCFWKPD